MLSEKTPFVLLEDARPGPGGGRLFQAPTEVVAARTMTEVAPALERLRAARRAGLYAAGWLSYEAGFAFEERLAVRAEQWPHKPLLWFGLFDQQKLLARYEIDQLLPSPDGAWLSQPRPRISRDAYASAFDRIRHYIRAGDVYQVNLSFRADLTLLGNPLAAYARLRSAGQGGWSAVVHADSEWLLSTSPELFFKLENGCIEARPMKGTARRHADPEHDKRAAAALQADEKERAENLMIVDLLRNDISRVADRGSVSVPSLFSIETYPTLHTLTSTVRARLRARCDAIDVLRALFPCGSITGAPKIRAMEIIDELEAGARGIYTGSIGWLAPNGDAEFNVAIRTIAVTEQRAELGLGSAIVIDSTPQGEWKECLTKAAFVNADAPVFQLIETMRADPKNGVARLDLHLARLRTSADTFQFTYDERAVRNALDEALGRRQSAQVVRLLLAKNGGLAFELRELPSASDGPLIVTLAPLPVEPQDFRLRYKTTLRDFYDRAREQAAAQEVVFVDRDGFLTEGSFTNIFVERDGVLVTPPLARGLLPGVLRAELLRDGKAFEGDLRADDLAGGFFVGNSVRGVLPAKLAKPRAGVTTTAQSA